MKYRFRSISAVVILLFLCFSINLFPNPGTASEKPQNVILIGWDGAQRNHIKECLERKELPNLLQLSKEGTVVSIDILRTTDTKAGWSQILSGYEPETTGVFSNKTYKPIPIGLTIFERLETFFGTKKIYTGAIIGKKDNVDNTEGKPFFNCTQKMDLFLNGLTYNSLVGLYTLSIIESNQKNQFFLFVHFAEVDSYGHQFGENSKEYNNALISSDYWTGEIMNTLKELGLYEQTKIYITSDHGFDEGKNSHNDAPYVFLGTNDKGVIRCGTRADITPTILDRMGVPLDTLKPKLDGHSLLRPFTEPIW